MAQEWAGWGARHNSTESGKRALLVPRILSLVPRILSFLLLYPCSSKRLVTLARGLSPAFLRFGGKRTDFLQFQNLRNPAKSRGGPGPDYYLKNYEDGEKLAPHSCWVREVWGVGASNRYVCVWGADLEEGQVEAHLECGIPDVITQRELIRLSLSRLLAFLRWLSLRGRELVAKTYDWLVL